MFNVTTASPALTASSTSGTYSYTVTSGGLNWLLMHATGAINPSTNSAGVYSVTYSVAAQVAVQSLRKYCTVLLTSAPTAVAGAAMATCANSGPVNITMGSSATNSSSVVWTSSGTGTISNGLHR